MHIEIEIEEEEEHIVTSSEDDDMEDENYQVSPRAARGVAFDDDEDEDIVDEPMRQVEHGDEEEEGIEGTANPQQRGRVLKKKMN
jgi:hypothetical protein